MNERINEEIAYEPFGRFILTLINKGYRVNIIKNLVIRDGFTIYITRCILSTPYTVCKTIMEDDLRFMTKDTLEDWFIYLIGSVEAEFNKMEEKK